MAKLDQDELMILHHFKGDWKELKTFEGISQSTLYRKKDKLLEDGLLDEKPREGVPGNLYKTTDKGVKALDEIELESEGIQPAGLAPTPEHEAMIELILAAVAARRVELMTDHNPTFVQVGGTLKWKSWLAKFVSYLLDLDPEKSVILMSSESGRSLLTRKGYAGGTVSQRDILSVPFVCFDEYQEAGSDQKKLCGVYLQGRTRVPYENQELEIKPVPLVNLNPQEAGSLQERTGLEERQIRRSIICDFDQVKIPESEKARGEEILEEIKGENITIPDQVPDLSVYGDWIQRAVNECVREEYRGLVDLEMLTLLSSGMGSFLGERVAVSRTVRDYLEVIKTLGWTEEGWPKILNILADELREKPEVEREVKKTAPKATSLIQQALGPASITAPSSPLDYDAKLAKLKGELVARGLGTEEALVALKEIGVRCRERGKNVSEVVDKVVSLLDEHESIESSVQSVGEELSEAKGELWRVREETSKLNSGIDGLERKTTEFREQRDKTEVEAKYALEVLAKLDKTLRDLNVSPDKIESFVERQKTLDKLGFGQKEAEAVAKELGEGGELGDALKRIMSLIEEHGSLQNARDRLQGEVWSLKETLSGQMKLAEERESERKKLDELKKSLEEEVKGIESKLHELRGEVTQIENEKGKVDGELQEMLKTKKRAEEIAKSLDDFKSLEGLLSGKRDKLKELEARLNSVVENKENVENSIQELKESGVKQVKELADFVRSEIQRLDARAEKLHGGEVALAKREGEVNNLERELENARYFVNLPMATDLAKKLVEDWSPLPIVQYMQFAVEWSKQHVDMALAPPPSLVKKHPYVTLGMIKLSMVEVFEWALYCASTALTASTTEKREV